MKKSFFLSVLFLTSLLCHSSLFSNEDIKDLLITGCGRSGTTFTADYLKACGFDISHESAQGTQGCVSWPMAVKYYSPFTPYPVNTCFRHVFHQVKDPLDVISSFYTNLPNLNLQEWHFIRTFIPEILFFHDSALTHCAKYWYYWNLKAEQISEWRYRIEDIHLILDEFETRSGFHLDPEILDSLPKTINHWKLIDRKITWNDLRMALSPEFFQNLQEMAQRYGYPIED